jgi:biopolymer transport protein ExbB/TolQ
MSLWGLLLGGGSVVGVTVNLTIFLLFFVGCVDIIRSLFKLAKERRLVQAAAKILHSNSGDAAQAAMPTLSPEAMLTYLRVNDRSLLGHRIKRALQLRLAGLGNRDVLQQVTSERLGSYGSLARQIGATLTLLGLLGTVFGLSVALLKIGDASNIKGVEDLGLLSQALGGTMGGMETAFGCTLAGLLTAVVMSFLNFGLRRVQSVVLGGIEEFTTCELLRALEHVDPESENATKAFANVLNDVSEDMVQLSSQLRTAASDYMGGATAMQSTLNVLVGTVNSLSEIVNRMAGNQAEVSETMRATRTALDGVGTIVESSSQLLLERLGQMQQHAAAVGQMQESLLGHHEEFKKTAETMRSTFTASMQETTKAHTESMQQAMTAHAESIRQTTTTHADSMRQAMAAHAESMQQATTAQINTNKQMIEEILRKHTEGLKALVDQSQHSLLEILEKNSEMVRAALDIVLDARMNKEAQLGIYDPVGGDNETNHRDR